jgi:hypothetical protein
MSYIAPTVTEFKTFFARDFPFGSDITISIVDADIERAQAEVLLRINEGIICSQELYTSASLYLAAHILVINIRNSSQGLSSKFAWAVASKSVGSVSTSSALPSDITQNPFFSWYTSSGYGMNYLMLMWPLLAGAVVSTPGGTQA